MKGRVLQILVRDPGESVVPPAGFTAWLVLFSAAAMAFLAVCALVTGFAAGRLADRWTNDLNQSTTIELPSDAAQLEAQIETVLRVLSETPGVLAAKRMDLDAQQDLLTPWLGADLPLQDLPVPTLIVVSEDAGGVNAESLRLRLAAEAPDARYDDHGQWREPVAAAGARLRLIAWGALLLIMGTMGVMIALAALAALAANAPVIRTLRLIGARDVFIARAFVRRFTMRAFWGAAAGAALAAVVFRLMPDPAHEGAFVTGLGLQGWQWLSVPLIPLVACLTAYTVTRRAAMRSLRRLDDL